LKCPKKLINSISNEEEANTVKEFVDELIHLLNKPNLQDSFAEHTHRSSTLTEFRQRFKIYEDQISLLTTEVSEKQSKLKEASQKVEGLTSENSELKKEVNRLNVYLTEIKDEQTLMLREKEQNLKKTFDSQKRDLNVILEGLQKQVAELKDQNSEYLQAIAQLTLKVKDCEDTINTIPNTYVLKAKYEELNQEKSKLEKKVLELENTIYAQTSENESLRAQTATLRNNLERAMFEKEHRYKSEIDDLTDQLKKKCKTLEEYEVDKKDINGKGLRRQSSSKFDEFYNDNMKFSYRFLNIDESAFTKDLNNHTQDTQLNQNLLEKFEYLQQMFEKHRIESTKENSTLNNRIKELTYEINKLKTQNKMIAEEKLSLQKSVREFNSREISVVKKNPEMSGEFVEKLVRVDQQNKTLRVENKLLKEKVLKMTTTHGQETDLLYSAVYSHFLKMY